MKDPRLLTFDVESTGVDTRNDRIVTAFVGLMSATGFFIQQYHPLVNPGVEIPEGASAVHGISTAKAQAEGIPPRQALEQLRFIIEKECVGNGVPLVAFNAPFDLTMLKHELERHGLPPIEMDRINVIDPMVLDKRLTPIRRGRSRLTDIAPLYGVPVEANAHDAGADCLMTGRIALQMLSRQEFRDLLLPELHQRQIGWKAKQAANLQAYFHSAKGGYKTDIIIDGGWPLQNGVSA